MVIHLGWMGNKQEQEVRSHQANTRGGRHGSTHLSDGVQQFAVGVEDDAEGQEQAEHKQADDVGDVVGRLGPPVH